MCVCKYHKIKLKIYDKQMLRCVLQKFCFLNKRLFSAVTRFAVASHDCKNEERELWGEQPWHGVRLNLFLSLFYLNTLLKCIGHVGKLDFYVPLSERVVITAEGEDNH